MYKFLVWHVLIVVTSCELFAQESGYLVGYAPKYLNYRPKDYNFNYAVSDPHTGDHKSQWEVKENGVVRGGYSLLEPDGTTRIVEYIADDDGFRAVVKKLGTAVHPEPLVPVVPQVAHYGTYSGQVENYANLAVPPILYQFEQTLGQGATVLSQPQPLGTLQETPSVPIQGQNVAEIEANLRPVEAVPNLGRIEQAVPPPVVPVGHSYSYELNFGGVGGNLAQTQDLRPVLNSEVVQTPNLGTLNTVPLAVEQGVGRIEADLSQIEALPGKIEGLPLLQEEKIGELPITEAQWRRIEGVEAVPIQGHDIAEIEANLRRIGELSVIQEPNIGRIEAVPVQGHGLGAVEGEIRRLEAVPNFGNIESGIGTFEAAPVQGQGVERVDAVPLPQPQIEIHAARPLPDTFDNSIGQGPAPGVVPVGPSGTYSTSIEYHGLTGNPEDDSRYTQERKEVYHASYSQKIAKMVPAPSKKEKLSKKEFLIYYPDSESH